MSDLTATNCGGGCGCDRRDCGNNNSCIWIILILLFCGNGFGGRDCDRCNDGCNNGLGGLFGGGDCSCIIIIIVLLCCCGGNGFGFGC